MAPSKRTKILVDRTFQLQYLKIFLLIGLGVACASVAVVLIPHYLKNTEIDPKVVTLLMGLCIFIVLLCTLMGVLSVALTHRVAGASLRLNRFIQDLVVGEGEQEVRLRKNDYLQSLAESLNVLAIHVRTRQSELYGAAGRLEALRDELEKAGALAAPQRAALDEVIARLRTTRPPAEPTPAP